MRLSVCVLETCAHSLVCCSLVVLLSQNAWPAAQLNNQNKVSKRTRELSLAWRVFVAELFKLFINRSRTFDKRGHETQYNKSKVRMCCVSVYNCVKEHTTHTHILKEQSAIIKIEEQKLFLTVVVYRKKHR